MSKNLLIVFAKNKLYGKVKTRLAKSVGEQSAFDVYARLFEITETESCAVSNADVEVHFSHEIDEAAWIGHKRFVQVAGSLGDRMSHAFKRGFERGYENIIGIGADLPEISTAIIEKGFNQLATNDFVFGPAIDGGYYLVGMRQAKGMYIFDNKPWSTPELYERTKAEILFNTDRIAELKPLNDIDTIDDLEKSCIAEEFRVLFEAD